MTTRRSVAGSDRSSPYASDAADRPGPFVFPLSLPQTVDPSFAGLVDVTVEGLDWDTHAVIASGTTSGAVVAQKTTTASLTLQPTAQPGAGADGGRRLSRRPLPPGDVIVEGLRVAAVGRAASRSW